MPISLIKPENPDFKPKLEFRNLIPGDFLVISVDRMHKEFNNSEYGPSYLCFVDVYEYNYFDTKNRKTVEEKFSEPERCSVFLNQKMWEKIEPKGQDMIRIEAVETNRGKTAYFVKDIDEPLGNPMENKKLETKDDPEVIEPDLGDKDGITDADKEKIKSAIAQFRELGFTDSQVMNNLKGKFPEEVVKELM